MNKWMIWRVKTPIFGSTPTATFRTWHEGPPFGGLYGGEDFFIPEAIVIKNGGRKGAPINGRK